MAGRAFISAIVHESSSTRERWQRVIEGTERFDDVLERIDGLEVGKRILDRCHELKEFPARAEPGPPQAGDVLYDKSLAAFDLPLHRLVEAERARQIEGMAAAAARIVRLVGSRT